MPIRPQNHSEMSPNENLHYAIGMIAFSMAFADGEVQKEERAKFQSIVEAELRSHDVAFNVSDIIFKIMDRSHHFRETSYNWAIHEIRTNSHYLSPKLKATFLHVIERISVAYPPVTAEEKAMLEKFRKDIEPLHGDPVYYDK